MSWDFPYTEVNSTAGFIPTRRYRIVTPSRGAYVEPTRPICRWVTASLQGTFLQVQRDCDYM